MVVQPVGFAPQVRRKIVELVDDDLRVLAFGRDPAAEAPRGRPLELDVPRLRVDLVTGGADLPPDGDELIGQPSHLHRLVTSHRTTLTRSNWCCCGSSVAKLRTSHPVLRRRERKYVGPNRRRDGPAGCPAEEVRPGVPER